MGKYSLGIFKVYFLIRNTCRKIKSCARISLFVFSYLILQSQMMVSQMVPVESIMIW